MGQHSSAEPRWPGRRGDIAEVHFAAVSYRMHKTSQEPAWIWVLFETLGAVQAELEQGPPEKPAGIWPTRVTGTPPAPWRAEAPKVTVQTGVSVLSGWSQ